METSRDKINFKSVHEGMGFHPFSDGLPYAPVSKSVSTDKKTDKQNDRQSIPTYTPPPATKTFARPATPVQTLDRSSAAAPVFAQKIPQFHFKTEVDEIKVQTTPEIHVQPGLTRKRVFAFLLDVVIHAFAWQIVNGLVLAFTGSGFDWSIVADRPAFFFCLFYVSQWFFIGTQEALFKSTLGKSFFELEFKTDHSSLFFRSLVFHLGLLCFGIGAFFKIQDFFGQVVYDEKQD